MAVKMTAVFLVNGTSASPAGYRARAFKKYLAKSFNIEICYREGSKLIFVAVFLRFLLDVKPHVTYVMDIGYSGILAAAIYRLLKRNVWVVDTGDCVYELIKSLDRRRGLSLVMTKLFEEFSLRCTNQVVVRGTFHRDYLSQKHIHAEIIHDGVETNLFIPSNQVNLKIQYGLNGALTIGLVGNCIWSPRLKMCYGWDLVELIYELKEFPVKGLFIGDGSGIEHLKGQAKTYGIESRLIFLGFIPYENLTQYLNMIDICLSTQTNDLVGQVRTTGKLPLYMACGRYILASKVGEASLVLPPDMLVDYEGIVDHEYPKKLAKRIKSILDKPAVLNGGGKNREVAKVKFDYSVLAERMASLLFSLQKRT